MVRERMGPAAFPWWVGGGWAAEAAGATPRAHEDTDLVILERDVPALRSHLADHHLWEAYDGSLRPLRPGEPLREGRTQLWVRRNGTSPWVLDILFSPSEGDEWLFKRDHRVRLPVDRLGWVAPDGVSYLRPEVVLLFKAKHRRAKDGADLDSLLPRLDDVARRWLLEALAVAHPGHPWAARLRDPSPSAGSGSRE